MNKNIKENDIPYIMEHIHLMDKTIFYYLKLNKYKLKYDLIFKFIEYDFSKIEHIIDKPCFVYLITSVNIELKDKKSILIAACLAYFTQDNQLEVIHESMADSVKFSNINIQYADAIKYIPLIFRYISPNKHNQCGYVYPHILYNDYKITLLDFFAIYFNQINNDSEFNYDNKHDVLLKNLLDIGFQFKLGQSYRLFKHLLNGEILKKMEIAELLFTSDNDLASMVNDDSSVNKKLSITDISLE